MSDLLTAGLLFVALCGCFLIGRAVHRLLPETHRSHETLEFVRVISNLLVTFTALVLGLLLVTVDGDFRKANEDLRLYGSMIELLDAELIELGAPAVPARATLRRYTAAAIASTWPEEPAPDGTYPKPGALGGEMDSYTLGDMLHAVEKDVRSIAPQGPGAEKVRDDCLERISALLDQRGRLISDAHGVVTPFIFATMILWLLIVFFSFGLTAPQNPTTLVAAAVVGLAVASAVLLMFELDGPLDGLIKVSSGPERHALHRLDRVPAAPP